MTISPTAIRSQAEAFIQQASRLYDNMQTRFDPENAGSACETITTAFQRTMTALGTAPEFSDLRGRAATAYQQALDGAETLARQQRLPGLGQRIHALYERATNPAAPAPVVARPPLASIQPAAAQAQQPTTTPAPVDPVAPAQQRPRVLSLTLPVAQPLVAPVQASPRRAPIDHVVEQLIPGPAVNEDEARAVQEAANLAAAIALHEQYNLGQVPFAAPARHPAVSAEDLAAVRAAQEAADLEAALALHEQHTPRQAAPAAPANDDAAFAAAIQASLNEQQVPQARAVAARPPVAVAARAVAPADDEDIGLAHAIALSLQVTPAVQHQKTIVVNQDVGYGNRLALFGEGTIWIEGRQVHLSWNPGQGVNLQCEDANVWTLAFTHAGRIECKIVLIENGRERFEDRPNNREFTGRAGEADHPILEALTFGPAR